MCLVLDHFKLNVIVLPTTLPIICCRFLQISSHHLINTLGSTLIWLWDGNWVIPWVSGRVDLNHASMVDCEHAPKTGGLSSIEESWADLPVDVSPDWITKYSLISYPLGQFSILLSNLLNIFTITYMVRDFSFVHTMVPWGGVQSSKSWRPSGQMASVFDIQHRSCSQQGNADGLSRCPCIECTHCERQENSHYHEIIPV